MATFKIEFDALPGQFFELDLSDNEAPLTSAVNRALKAANLWRPGELCPQFTLYADNEIVGGGGGTHEGTVMQEEDN